MSDELSRKKFINHVREVGSDIPPLGLISLLCAPARLYMCDCVQACETVMHIVVNTFSLVYITTAGALSRVKNPVTAYSSC